MCNRDDYYSRVERLIAEEQKDICEDCTGDCAVCDNKGETVE